MSVENQIKHELRISELRVGNYVNLHKGDSVKPYQISSGFDLYKLDENDCADISPIPLTEELLVKCGGVKLEHKMFPCYNVNGIQLILRGGWFECVHDIHIKSLHQFQNFYFFTKQQELTIEI